MKEIFFDYINTFLNFSEEEQDYYWDFCEVKKIKKNEIVTKEGDVESYMYYNVNGLFRMFFNYDGKEITNMFLPEKQLVSAFDSFLTGNVSQYNLQAIVDTDVVAIKRELIYALYDFYPKTEKIGRLSAEFYALELMKYLYNSHILDSTDRYNDFVKNNPELVKKLPIKYISTYLGIHPNSLSRIRAKVKKNRLKF